MTDMISAPTRPGGVPTDVDALTGLDLDTAPIDTAPIDTEQIATEICRDVGMRLRSLREQRQMSLQDVEVFSEGAFVPSTIGAYERGERAISLPRLQRLADLYGVPVEQLIPASEGGAAGYRPSPITEALRIDAAKINQLSGHGFQAVARFIDNVRAQRGDWQSSVITLRGSDAIVIAAMLDVPVQQVVDRLRALDLWSAPAA